MPKPLPLFFLTVSLVIFTACASGPKVPAPVAEKKPVTLSKHDHERIDEYLWMRERENPEVRAHLERENAHLESVLKPVSSLRESLFNEMKGRMKEDDSSPPVPYKGYEYYHRVEAGKQYPIHARRRKDSTQEEILLDVNRLAEGKSFTNCSGPSLSDSQNLMIYGCDFVGRNFFEIRGINLETGEDLGISIKDVRPRAIWSKDDRYFFYVQQDPETLRNRWVYRFDRSDGTAERIFEERDETYSVYLSRSGAENFLFIISSSTLSSEVRYVSLDNPRERPRLFLRRERDHLYSITDGGDRFFVLTNWEAKNFRIMEVPLDRTARAHWREIVPHRSDVYLEDLSAYSTVLTWSERRRGLEHLVIRDRATATQREIPFEDESYLASWGVTAEYDSAHLRYQFESMRQPPSTLDYDLASGTSKLIKTREVPNFKSGNYRTERIWVKARDGTEVPVSILMPARFKAGSGRTPLLVYGYGSYGASMSPWFSSSRLSLVDRGWVFAIAHVRGGSELGRDWYDQGRTFNKMNTFHDFIDVTEALVSRGYGDRSRVYARGGSAGGLLMGAVMNLRPDLYRGIVAEVPFVDVVTTMLDETIPLTTGEYDEWGNPHHPESYKYILGYSPYDNVKKADYPHLLATTGFHDSQVQYWEPAKWVARLRDSRTNDRLTLLKTDLESGHGGASGRYNALRDEALVQSFLLMINR